MVKSLARQQWFYIAILSAYSLISSGDPDHHQIDAVDPVAAEQLLLPELSDHSSTFEFVSHTEELNTSQSWEIGAWSSFVHHQLRLEGVQFTQFSKKSRLIDRPIFFIIKKIPPRDSEGPLS